MSIQRVSAEQAVEFLKIHQLRRENSAILQHVDKLHEEVSNLQKRVENAEAAANKATSSINNIQAFCEIRDKTANQMKTQVEQLKADLQLLNDTVSSWKSRPEKELDQEQNLQTKLKDTDEKAKGMVATLRTEVDERIGSFQNMLKAIEEHTIKKANVVELEALQQEIAVLRFVKNDRSLDERQTSQVYKSIEDNVSEHLETDNHTCSNLESHQRDVSQPIRATPEDLQPLSQSEDIMLTLEQPKHNPKLAIEKNHSANECFREISYIDHNVDLSSPNPRSQSLENAETQTSNLVSLLLSLKQATIESTSQYLARNEQLLEKMPLELEELFLRRFVGGLKCVEHHNLIKRWLDTSEWNMTNARDCIRLLEIGLVEKPATEHVQVSAPLTEIDEPESLTSKRAAMNNTSRTKTRQSRRILERRSRKRDQLSARDSQRRSKKTLAKPIPFTPDNEQSTVSKEVPTWMRPRDNKGRFITRRKAKKSSKQLLLPKKAGTVHENTGPRTPHQPISFPPLQPAKRKSFAKSFALSTTSTSDD